MQSCTPLLNAKARIPVCGMIAAYNATSLPNGPDRLGMLMGLILRKRMTMKGFIIFDDYGPRFGEFYEQMSVWVKDGKIKHREDMIVGLDKAPEGLIGLLEGKNFGSPKLTEPASTFVRSLGQSGLSRA